MYFQQHIFQVLRLFYRIKYLCMIFLEFSLDNSRFIETFCNYLFFLLLADGVVDVIIPSFRLIIVSNYKDCFVWIGYLPCWLGDDDVTASESVGRRRRKGRSAVLPSTLVTATYFKNAHVTVEQNKSLKETKQNTQQPNKMIALIQYLGFNNKMIPKNLARVNRMTWRIGAITRRKYRIHAGWEGQGKWVNETVSNLPGVAQRESISSPYFPLFYIQPKSIFPQFSSYSAKSARQTAICSSLPDQLNIMLGSLFFFFYRFLFSYFH